MSQERFSSRRPVSFPDTCTFLSWTIPSGALTLFVDEVVDAELRKTSPSQFYCLSLSLLSHHYFCYYHIKGNFLGRKLEEWRKLLFAFWECFDIRPGIPHSQEDWLRQLSYSGDILASVLWSKSRPEWIFQGLLVPQLNAKHLSTELNHHNTKVQSRGCRVQTKEEGSWS